MVDFTKWRPPLNLILAHGGTKKSGKYVKWAVVEWMEDDQPDLSWLERTVEDYMGEGVTREEAERSVAWDRKRLEAYGDTWFSVGLRAKADVVIGGTLQEITSSGIWGVESDAGDYFRSLAREEIADLDSTLEEMGLPQKRYEVDEVKFP